MRYPRIVRYLIWLAILSLIWVTGSRTVQAAVTLVSFTATGGTEWVEVDWMTATELANAGFFVWRSDSQDGTYDRISEFIESLGDPLTGYEYFWIDYDVVIGTTYWYKLEAIDLGQNTEFFGPVSATPGVPEPTGTMTLTPTLTQTSTQTPTGTIIADQTAGPTASVTATTTSTSATDATITLTSTPPPSAPTRTPPGAYPAPRTATLAAPVSQPATLTVLPATPTRLPPTAIPTIPTTPTTTLLPFPDLTLTFPVGGIVLPGGGTSTLTPAPGGSQEATSGWFPQGGILLVGILVLIWALLGAWFYLSFRRIQ